MASVNYTKFLTTDLDSDGLSELFVLRPGETETDNGAVEVYSMKSGAVERFNESVMSAPAHNLKRLIVGLLYTYIGLVLFLTGVNVGFMPIGYKIGFELAKTNMNNTTKSVLLKTLNSILKMLHPFMPYVTEEIYQKLPIK